MNKITRKTAKEMGFEFNDLISDMDETSYEEHRKGSEFFTRAVIVINEEWFPEVPRELDGFWETNTFISHSDYGYEEDEITELNRVVQKEEVVTRTYWERVEK